MHAEVELVMKLIRQDPMHRQAATGLTETAMNGQMTSIIAPTFPTTSSVTEIEMASATNATLPIHA